MALQNQSDTTSVVGALGTHDVGVVGRKVLLQGIVSLGNSLGSQGRGAKNNEAACFAFGRNRGRR